MDTGVYKIINKENGRFYIGSTSRSLKARWGQHKTLLRHNNHNNKAMQEDWNMFGESVFDFVIIEEAESNILTKEAYYLQLYFDNGIKCYNSINRAASGKNFQKSPTGSGQSLFVPVSPWNLVTNKPVKSHGLKLTL